MATPGDKDRAVVTLVTTDNYLPGALVALRSLLDAEGAAPSPTSRAFATVALVTPATVGHGTVTALQKAFDVVIGVEQILSESLEELKLLGMFAPTSSRAPAPRLIGRVDRRDGLTGRSMKRSWTAADPILPAPPHPPRLGPIPPGVAALPKQAAETSPRASQNFTSSA